MTKIIPYRYAPQGKYLVRLASETFCGVILNVIV
jgi:hypothetical protein